MHVLDLERIAQRTGDEQPAARDSEDQIGYETVRDDGGGELSCGGTELVPRQCFPIGHWQTVIGRGRFRGEERNRLLRTALVARLAAGTAVLLHLGLEHMARTLLQFVT